MQPKDSSIFADVSDYFGIDNPAIAEKDYYVVQLLKLLASHSCQHHTMVFAGGTALAKADVKLQRMSEDVDIKLSVNDSAKDESRSAMKRHRKAIRDGLIEELNATGVFQVEKAEVICRDEHRYIEMPVRYPQAFSKAPCLRPFIKLELIETDLLAGHNPMPICSLHNEAMQQGPEVPAFNTVPLISTQAEKVLSMLRRTASVKHDPKRLDDESLVRHIYDTYRLQQSTTFDLAELSGLIAEGMKMDRDRYGPQHPEFAADPIGVMRFGLDVIAGDPLYKDRYEAFVKPMVYGDALTWDEAFRVFEAVARQALDHIEQHKLI